jgi:hypothetical protein
MKQRWDGNLLSERDLDQKLEMQRVFWSMGASTRIDVKLGALVPRTASKTRAGVEDWTDLDVLGVEYTPMTGLGYAIADCKTVRGRVTERVFWLRGVADLFGARAIYLVRDEAPPPASRQLAVRLGVGVLDFHDRQALMAQAGDSRTPAGASFLGREAFKRWTSLTSETPSSVERLQRYRRSLFWVVGRHRNLTQLPSHLGIASKAFVPDQRWAHAVLCDLAWLYLLAVAGALDELTRLQLADPRAGLRQAVVGSEQELREKERLAAQLAQVIEAVEPQRVSGLPAMHVLPEYFEDLLDLVLRFGRRRNRLVGALRALEFVGLESIACRGLRWADAFPAETVEGKMASDVVRFLVKACHLDPEFVTAFDSWVVPGADEANETPGGDSPIESVASPVQPSLFAEPRD